MLKSGFRKQAGDTIVEVIVVLAVLGLAIGIAYATANRSLLNARQAQENAEATSIAQSQIEQIRAASPDSAALIYHTPTNYFCFDAAGNFTPFITVSPSLVYPAGCQQQNIPYKVSVQYDSSKDQTFIAQVVWDDVLGQGQDSTTLIYKVHPQP